MWTHGDAEINTLKLIGCFTAYTQFGKQFSSAQDYKAVTQYVKHAKKVVQLQTDLKI